MQRINCKSNQSCGCTKFKLFWGLSCYLFCNVPCQNKKHVYLSGKIWSNKVEKFFQVIQMEKPGVENLFQKQLCRGILSESCSESMHQIYRRTLMPKCDFSKVAKELYWITPRYGCSPLNLLHTFRTPFTKNTSGWFLLLINHKNTKQM